MEYPYGHPYGHYNDVPVILDQRPYRNRPRLASEHHNKVYYQDANGLLVPAQTIGAGVRRSHSHSGPKTAPIIINNNQWDDPSPERKRRSYHDPHYSSSEEYDDRSHSHERRRLRSRSRGRHHKNKSRTPSPPDLEMERKLQRLEELEEREKEEAARQKFEEERIIEEARKDKEAKEKEALKKLVIEEHNAKVLEEEMKKKKKKEEEDKAFQERMRETLTKAGYSEASIEKTLKGKADKGSKIMDLTRPTYIKVHRKHLSPDTLDIYDLPWEWDDVSNTPIKT